VVSHQATCLGILKQPAAARQPVLDRNCVSCHMPKYAVPEMHFRFTDHLIRVVREKKQP
jgi:hypothetical protein